MSREQLLALGVSRQVVEGALRAGRLRPLMRGVYAVGHRAVTREGWWMAALLACGDGATLSHRSAAMFWGLLTVETPPVDVITPGDAGRKQRLINKRTLRLHETEHFVVNRMRITTPARTLVDLAGVVDAREMRRCAERAQDRNRFSEKQIEAILERHPRRPGCRPLRDLVRLLGPDRDGARSYLERLFLKLVRGERLPIPEVNARIAGRRRDFVWPEARLVVETDGYRWHSSREARRRDARRDRELTAIGWRPVRFTYEEVAFEPRVVAADLRTLLV